MAEGSLTSIQTQTERKRLGKIAQGAEKHHRPSDALASTRDPLSSKSLHEG